MKQRSSGKSGACPAHQTLQVQYLPYCCSCTKHPVHLTHTHFLVTREQNAEIFYLFCFGLQLTHNPSDQSTFLLKRAMASDLEAVSNTLLHEAHSRQGHYSQKTSHLHRSIIDSMTLFWEHPGHHYANKHKAGK